MDPRETQVIIAFFGSASPYAAWAARVTITIVSSSAAYMYEKHMATICTNSRTVYLLSIFIFPDNTGACSFKEVQRALFLVVAAVE